MPMTIEQLAEEALALPSEQRALLADRLVESLDAGEANRLDRLWTAEAKRRRDEVRQELVQTIPGDEALARVRRSLGR
ncbi:MAG: addiction module protein [Verrucomicrobiales bacterium]